MTNNYDVAHALEIVADRNSDAADILRAEIERLRSYLEWLRVNVDSEFTEANIQAAIDTAKEG